MNSYCLSGTMGLLGEKVTALKKPDKTTRKPQGLAYLSRARVRARGQDSVKSLMTQARYSLKMPKKGTSFRLMALGWLSCHLKFA